MHQIEPCKGRQKAIANQYLSPLPGLNLMQFPTGGFTPGYSLAAPAGAHSAPVSRQKLIKDHWIKNNKFNEKFPPFCMSILCVFPINIDCSKLVEK